MKKFSFKEAVLFEDDNYIIINKPAGVSTLEDRNDPLNILKAAKILYEDVFVCHRLDKDTSGILVLAKNEDAHKHLSVLFEKRKVQKIYHAVVDGVSDFKKVVVEKPIKVTGKGTVKIDHRQGKPSKTTFDSLTAYKNHTLVQCTPETGRMHQIRIHLAELATPIVSDATYGGRQLYLSSIKRKYNLKKWTEELPLIRRMALHAFSIEFKDLKDKKIYMEAPYPKDFRVLVDQLEKNR